MMVDQGHLVSPEFLLAWAADQRWRSEVGRELMELVRLPGDADEELILASVTALEEFQSSPEELSLAVRLSRVLQVRAKSDEFFQAGLSRWVTDHHEPSGPVNIVISGGTFNGNVVQGRDFNTVHVFTSDPGLRGD